MSSYTAQVRMEETSRLTRTPSGKPRVPSPEHDRILSGNCASYKELLKHSEAAVLIGGSQKSVEMRRISVIASSSGLG